MSKFDEYWDKIDRSFASDAARYFAKPMLRAAFEAGRAAEKLSRKKIKPVPSGVAQ